MSCYFDSPARNSGSGLLPEPVHWYFHWLDRDQVPGFVQNRFQVQVHTGAGFLPGADSQSVVGYQTQ